jgi:hypothetical protein
MPLVFVHGVNNRRGETQEEKQVYNNRMALMSEQFRNVAFAERVSALDGLAVFMPYWGDLGVTFARNLACLPQTGVQALAVGQPEVALLMEATVANLDTEVLRQAELGIALFPTLARMHTLGAAVDLLFAGAANAPLPGILFDEAALRKMLPDAARFADAAEQYAAANPKPAWLSSITDDDMFISQLINEVKDFTNMPTGAGAGVQVLGLGDTLKSWLDNAVAAVQGAVAEVQYGIGTATSAAVSTMTQGARRGFLGISRFARPAASAFIGRFFGDVFKYMENREPIIDLVLADVNKAVKAKRPGDDEIYIVGHSFGGIILYDILTHFRPNLECDLYITVGSQVSLFAEIGRLADKDSIAAAFAVSQASLVPRPPTVKRWLNVFDPTDLVGFGTRSVFTGARDYQFETDALPIISHGAYFDMPRFYARLRERIREAFQNGTDIP